MAKIFLVDLESVETRYTGQWKHHVPEILTRQGHEVHVISGPTDIPSATTPGAFLNFGGTNIYKSSQVEQMGRLFCDGAVKPGDHFIFTDAWHPGIINLKYMSSLLNIPVKIHALWHAGSYDPQDFLGRLIGNSPWVRHAEKSFFNAIDHNYFATNFHIEMFVRNLLNDGLDENPWIDEDIEDALYGKRPYFVRSGWPMEYMQETLSPFKNLKKRNLILFPHRLAPEKQLEIFKDLELILPQYEFIVCQEKTLSKDEYHKLLGQAKMVFSANLQETLGISCYEGCLVDAIPFVPDRLSYKEMYYEGFKYPSKWTESWDSYLAHRQDICYNIITLMENYEKQIPQIRKQAEDLTQNFFSATNLFANLK
jgi:hypothetical protein